MPLDEPYLCGLTEALVSRSHSVSQQLLSYNYGIRNSDATTFLRKAKMDFRRARKDAGLTLTQLAELSGYAVGTISDLERTGEGGRHLREKLTSVFSGLKGQPGQPLSFFRA